MTLVPMSIAVVGADYPNRRGPARRFEISLCTPGEPIELRREPANKADPLAVAVFTSRNIQIGYLPAERCGRIGAMIARGVPVRAVFQAAARCGAYIRVTFDGSEPVLPNACHAPPSPPEFWPDEIYPDE